MVAASIDFPNKSLTLQNPHFKLSLNLSISRNSFKKILLLEEK